MPAPQDDHDRDQFDQRESTTSQLILHLPQRAVAFALSPKKKGRIGTTEAYPLSALRLLIGRLYGLTVGRPTHGQTVISNRW